MTPDERQKLEKRWWSLWRLIGAPILWSLHFLFCYVYAAIRCAKGGPLAPLDDVQLVIAVVTLLALAAVALGGIDAWRQTRIAGDSPPHAQSTVEDRHRFLSFAELLLAGLSFVAIVYTAIPAFVFADCR